MSAQKARPKGLLLVAGILLFAAVMIPIYWISFFSGAGVITSDPKYLAFEYAFPAADAWMAIAAFLGFIGLVRRKSWGVLFALLAGSASIFLGLMDVLFALENGIYLIGSSEVAIEIAINIVTLTLGPAVIWYVWTRRQSLL